MREAQGGRGEKADQASADTSAGGLCSSPTPLPEEGGPTLTPCPLKPGYSGCHLPPDRPGWAPSPAQPAHRPCTRRPRTGSCACAAACTGRRARSRPRTGTGKCAAAPRPSRSGTARTCAQTANQPGPGAAAPRPAPPLPAAPRRAPPRPAHRGPTPHRERRVRNQVPVCGNGIRSLATREVALTVRRKPARDSEGRREESVWGQDLKNPHPPAPSSQTP